MKKEEIEEVRTGSKVQFFEAQSFKIIIHDGKQEIVLNEQEAVELYSVLCEALEQTGYDLSYKDENGTRHAHNYGVHKRRTK